MSDKTEIKKIVIELEGKELNLTVESAKKLKELLNELFKDRETVYIPIDRYIPRPWHWDRWTIYGSYQGGNTNQQFSSGNTIYCSLGNTSNEIK
jgi:hypothetical protein